MNRIDLKFKRLKAEGRSALITYICAGDPTLHITYELVLELERSGADIIELGVPFSDPIADGPTIQRAAQRSLKHHTSLSDILELVRKIRQKSQVPILLMTYFNPVYQFGLEKLARAAAGSGVDGFIIPDLLPESGREISRILRKHKVDPVFLVSPLTSSKRLGMINRNSSGFVYYVSVTGVTGARAGLPRDIAQRAPELKKMIKKPIAVGFGVSAARQVAALSAWFAGVIVGSAIVSIIEKNIGKKDLVAKVGRFVKSLKS
ncbi:MAG: tryptophan synthase subunit alpha [Elusimicrobia bacterium]|nr:tryptophan synthase subunit alpha [Elusimicrobiota bacterium]